jgi:starvation-inducible outer membrane lipoprotein
MQYHYVVCYDDSTHKWSVEDETQYLDGNVWDTAEGEWFYPESWTPEYYQDQKCRQMVEVLATIWPECRID